MKHWIKKHKSIILKILLLIGIIAAVTGIAFGILIGTGILKFDNGISFNVELFNSVKNEWWFIIVFILMQVFITTLLCFVPGTSMAFIIGGVALFGASWSTFLICFSGVILSSFLMDALGRFGGAKIIIKLVGQNAYNEAYTLVNEKGLVYVPFMYLLPIFPDDLICLSIGVMKVKIWLHYLFIITCRGIGCATIVFGLTLIPYKTFTTFYEWFIFLTACLVWVVAILWLCNKLNKWLDKRRSQKALDKEQKQEYNKDNEKGENYDN